MSDRRHGRRGLLRVTLAAAALLASVAVGWHVSDRLEADNDFCTSCHITVQVGFPGASPLYEGAEAPDPEGTVRPLHASIRRDFDARPPVNLAGAHQRAGGLGAGRSGGDFRCIDCHGGVGLTGRARVKALAIKDAFFYVIGDFEEPDGMRWPLLDADCRQCHETFDDRGDGFSTRFHALAVHNVELGVACVSCHLAHDAGDPEGFFLDAPSVRVECARCHEEYASADPIRAFRAFAGVSRGKREVPLESRP